MLGSTMLMQVSTIRLNVIGLLELELGIKLEGIEASLSSFKLPNLDSIVENEPRVLIPPFPKKEEVKLEICRVFERCHGYC
jgi:hypothetical protein